MTRVLIVDDAAPMRALVAQAVNAAGHQVCGEASDVDGAMAAMAELSPDVVVVDGRLPPDGAPALLSRLREAAPAARFFVLASLEELDLMRDVRSAGAGILERPVRASRVAEALASLGEAPEPS